MLVESVERREGEGMRGGAEDCELYRFEYEGFLFFTVSLRVFVLIVYFFVRVWVCFFFEAVNVFKM